MKKLILILIVGSLFVGCGIFEEEEEEEEFLTFEKLKVYIDESCEEQFYSAEGTITEIAGSWATNSFSIAPLDTLEFELPNAGNYRILLATTLYTGGGYHWDKTVTIDENIRFTQGFNCGD